MSECTLLCSGDMALLVGYKSSKAKEWKPMQFVTDLFNEETNSVFQVLCFFSVNVLFFRSNLSNTF